MKIYTKVEFRWDGKSYVRVSEESFDYSGEVALCKGDQTAKQTEELQQQNAQQQLAQNQQFMNMMETQFGKQSQIYSYIQGKMQPMIDNPTGYSDQALASMRTSANDTISNNYQNAQKALNASNWGNTSRDLPSGVTGQLDAGLMAQEAGDKSTAQNQITEANANLQQQNYWNAVNALNGVGTETNPLGYASAATGASTAASAAGNSTANLANSYTQSQQSGLTSILGGLTGGIFGAAGAAGGFGNLFSGASKPCYVAAAVFNEDFETGVNTNAVRNWLWREWSTQHWYAKPVLFLYCKTGKWIAQQRSLVKMLSPLFHLALRKAKEAK